MCECCFEVERAEAFAEEDDDESETTSIEDEPRTFCDH